MFPCSYLRVFILYKLIDLCVIIFFIAPANKIMNNLYVLFESTLKVPVNTFSSSRTPPGDLGPITERLWMPRENKNGID